MKQRGGSHVFSAGGCGRPNAGPRAPGGPRALVLWCWTLWVLWAVEVQIDEPRDASGGSMLRGVAYD